MRPLRVIAGQAKGRRIVSQKNLGARPTTRRVRSSLFSVLQAEGFQDKQVLDLYAGTGTLGIEALSRGVVFADFVDSNPKRCSLIRRSLYELGFSPNAKVHCMKVETAIDRLGGLYDLVLMDPPYTLGPLHHIMEKVGKLAKDGALIATGHSKHHPLEDNYNALQLIRAQRYGDTICSIYRKEYLGN